MRRFEFRLERVLRLKRQRTRLAELRQQMARLAVEVAEARVAALREALERDALGLAGKIGRSLPVTEWLRARQHSTRLGRALQAAEEDLRCAGEELEQAAAARARAAAETEALLYLRQRALDAHRDAAERANQAALDELSLRRWQAARDAAGGDLP